MAFSNRNWQKKVRLAAARNAEFAAWQERLKATPTHREYLAAHAAGGDVLKAYLARCQAEQDARAFQR